MSQRTKCLTCSSSDTSVRFRRLLVERLELRCCPAFFSYVGVIGGDHTREGSSGNDTLNAIYIGANGNI